MTAVLNTSASETAQLRELRQLVKRADPICSFLCPTRPAPFASCRLLAQEILKALP
jgi:hypothetical protein